MITLNGEFFIARVPGHLLLYSVFDTLLEHYRLNSIDTLDSLNAGVRFTKDTSRYFVTALVFPAYSIRRIPFRLGRRRVFYGEGGVSEGCEYTVEVPYFLNRLLHGILVLDNLFRLPFGLSVMVIYLKTSAI